MQYRKLINGHLSAGPEKFIKHVSDVEERERESRERVERQEPILVFCLLLFFFFSNKKLREGLSIA